MQNNVSDTVVVMAAGTVTAPEAASAVMVKDVPPYENVPFTFVASNNKIVFTLDPSYFARVEGVMLNISVKDVYDMRSNKSNTETWTAYVNRNTLRWESNPVNLAKGFGDKLTFTASIVNTGGSSVNYAIQNLPSWLIVSNGSGNLQPLASRELTFTVNQGVNIGNYETEIGLTSGNGVTEILPLQLKVTGARPDWAANPADFELSMNLTSQIKIEDVFQEDTNDLLAAFIGNLCVGVASPAYLEANNAYFTFANVYGNQEHKGQLLTFKLWDSSTGRIYPALEASVGEIRFTSSATMGNISNPVIFNALDIVEQIIAFKSGWNWFSFNVTNDDTPVMTQIKSSLTTAGDIIKSQNAYLQQPGWVGTLTDVSATSMYSIKATGDHSLLLTGKNIDPASTPLTLENGWNWIGYLPQNALPVNSALAGINAQVDDYIKGQTGFAVYTGASGWQGSLNTMESGKGYMYRSGNNQAVTFNYPSNSSVLFRSSEEGMLRAPAADTHWKTDYRRYGHRVGKTAIVGVPMRVGSRSTKHPFFRTPE
jgi:hypothetical protein